MQPYIGILLRTCLKQNRIYHSLEGDLVCYSDVKDFLPQQIYTPAQTNDILHAIWDILVPANQNCLHYIYNPLGILMPWYSHVTQ